MKKLHLTRFAAVATVALMGSTAAWADVSASGTGWSFSSDGTLTLNSKSGSNTLAISSGEASTITGVSQVVVDRGTSGTTQFSTIMLPVDVSVDGHNQIVAAYTVGTMTYYDNNKVPELTMNSVTNLQANKPYIIKFKDGEFGTDKNITFGKLLSSVQPTDGSSHTVQVDGSCFSMTGTYETKQWNNGSSLSNDYGFSADDKGGVSVGQFVRIQNNPNNDCVTIYPARAYLTCTKPQLVNGLGKVAEESLPDVINVRFVDNEGGTLSIGTMNTKTGEIQMQDRYYDLKGRKLNGKPQNKVMYVNKKVIKH